MNSPSWRPGLRPPASTLVSSGTDAVAGAGSKVLVKAAAATWSAEMEPSALDPSAPFTAAL